MIFHLVVAAVLSCALDRAWTEQPAVSHPIPAFSIEEEAAVITVLVRPDQAASFDRVIAGLKSALERSANPIRKQQAAGWQVFKSQETAQGAVGYVMLIHPVVPKEEYDITRLIAETDPSRAIELNAAFKSAQIGRSTTTMKKLAIPGLGQIVGGAAESSRNVPSVPPILVFHDAEAAVLTFLIRPEHASNFEEILQRLGNALQASPDARRRRQASGWSVFRASAPFDGNLAYVMWLDPIVPDAEYELIRLIQESYPNEAEAIYTKYRQAYVGLAISRLSGRVVLSP